MSPVLPRVLARLIVFDRFAPSCGGGKHGDVRDLEGEQVEDLVKYLETF